MSHCLTCLFADAATPNANTVWLVILAISALGGNLATIGLWQATRRKQETTISPQPFLVAMEKEFTSKREFEKHKEENKDDHDKIFSKIGGVERGANAQIEQKVETVRKDVGSVREKVAGLEEATKFQNQTLASIGSKLDRIIENKLTGSGK